MTNEKVVILCQSESQIEALREMNLDGYEVIVVDSLHDLSPNLKDLSLFEAREYQPQPMQFAERFIEPGRQGKGERKRNRKDRWK